MDNPLATYIASLPLSRDLEAREIFAKILSENDDSGRHGVLIPKGSYGFFPELPVDDPGANTTLLFSAYDADLGRDKTLGWKYYQRYPERRITRLDPRLNDRLHGRRLVIFVRFARASGESVYYSDCALEDQDQKFAELIRTFFPQPAPTDAGAFISLPLDTPTFKVDDDLSELLARFDRIKSLGWVDSLRTGATGIGYTFETMAGIEENNLPGADFRGIEIKCKLRDEAASPSGKINLFQSGPIWLIPGPTIARLQIIGTLNHAGRLTCHSQVSTTPNNKGLWLDPLGPKTVINLLKSDFLIGRWENERLATRLEEKHARAVFVKAARRRLQGRIQYRYDSLLYCERPHIDRFLAMVASRRIVLEFTMGQDARGSVRNHGYPWRLVDERDLEELFALQVPLRLN